MVAVVCGLCLSFTACSDDDDDSKGGGESTEVGGGTVNELSLSDDETVLAALVQRWCEVEPEAIKPGIINQEFEPTVGYADGFVRTLEVGTLEAADEYAVTALSALNINPQQPAGFSWSGSIGTVSYQHGSGNELGVITVNIRQMPRLQKIRLVKDAEENAPNGGVAYYQKGDVVKYTGSGKYNGRYFLCLTDHKAGQPSNWICINRSSQDRSIGTCNWMMTGKDSVYNFEMASTSSLYIWLRDFVLDYDGWLTMVARLRDKHSNALNALLPNSETSRADLIRKLVRKPSQIVLDAYKPYSASDDTAQVVKAKWDKRVEKSKSSYVTEVYYPHGMLFCNSMRWSMGTTYDYWVPNLTLVKQGKDTNEMIKRLENSPSQSTLSKSHFESLAIPDLQLSGRGKLEDLAGTYDLYQTAVHWTHDDFKVPGDTKKHYGLLNFTTVDKNNYDNNFAYDPITSMELTVTDKGEAYKYFTDVYRARAKVDTKLTENYSIGDVLQDDQDGTLWFCLRPSASEIGTGMDHAMFVSFDGIKTYDNADRSAVNVPTKDEAYQSVLYITSALQTLVYGSKVIEGNIVLGNIRKYAKVDLESLFLIRDSVVNTDPTLSLHYSIAYNDGTKDKQPVIRVVFDGTHSLTKDRNKHAQDAYTYTRVYDRYQKWNGGGKAQWEGDWAMSDQRMYLGDVAELGLINQYATDKWVVLPLDNVANDGRHTKRMAPDYNGYKVSRYLWKDGKYVDTTALNMYNEPVLFFRTMWMKDKDQTMISSNGHTMTMLSHVSALANIQFGVFWWNYYTEIAPEYMTVNNVLQVPFQVKK